MTSQADEKSDDKPPKHEENRKGETSQKDGKEKEGKEKDLGKKMEKAKST